MKEFWEGLKNRESVVKYIYGHVSERLGSGLSPYRRCPEGTQNIIMYFVYILRSLKNNDIYIGSTENIVKRLNLHNKGKVRSTKAYRPWQLLDKEEFNSRSSAVRHERFLKTSQQKEILKRKYGQVSE